MNHIPNQQADRETDWARRLPREAFQEILLILRGALPPPLTNDPAAEIRRDRAAMAAVAALLPENAAEGRLAAQFVAADAWAMDCLRLAVSGECEFEVARKCRAQAMSLMREGKSALRVLLRMQAVRRKIEGDEEAAGRAAWVEHAAARMMAEGLDGALPASAPGGDGQDAGGGGAGGSGDGGFRCAISGTTPTPGPSPQGGGETEGGFDLRP